LLCPPKLAPLRRSAPFEPSDDGPFVTWRIVKVFMARPSAVTQGASKVKSCIDVPTTREMVAVEIRPAPVPRGAEHLREVPETYAIAEHTDEPNMSDGLENEGPKLLPANVRAVKK